MSRVWALISARGRLYYAMLKPNFDDERADAPKANVIAAAPIEKNKQSGRVLPLTDRTLRTWRAGSYGHCGLDEASPGISVGSLEHYHMVRCALDRLRGMARVVDKRCVAHDTLVVKRGMGRKNQDAVALS